MKSNSKTACSNERDVFWLPNNVKAMLALQGVSCCTPQKAECSTAKTGNTAFPACNRTIQSDKELTGALLEHREREYISTAQSLPSSNKHAVPIVSGAPAVHYVNIPSVPHHDYIQTLSRK